MIRLFWGLFFVLLDYKVSVGSAVIEVLPDFVGFFLLMKGMESLADKSIAFDRGRHLAFAMSLFTGVLFLADLMAPDSRMQIWLWLLELGAMIIGLCILKMILSGFRQMGRCGTENANSLWVILLVLLPLCHLLSWVPVVGPACGWAGMLASGLFLVSFYRCIRKSAG
jgi:hypothetical protein